MKRIFLIDCPGVVQPTGETETEIILKNVVSSLLYDLGSNAPTLVNLTTG